MWCSDTSLLLDQNEIKSRLIENKYIWDSSAFKEEALDYWFYFVISFFWIKDCDIKSSFDYKSVLVWQITLTIGWLFGEIYEYIKINLNQMKRILNSSVPFL